MEDCRRQYMVDGLSDLLQNNIWIDLGVYMGDRILYCHLPLLQKCSKYFNQFKGFLDCLRMD